MDLCYTIYVWVWNLTQTGGTNEFAYQKREWAVPMSAENLKIIGLEKLTRKIDWFDWTHQTHADVSTGLYAQPAKLDLNKKSFPKQKTIQNFTIDAQVLRKATNENRPTWEIEVTS